MCEKPITVNSPAGNPFRGLGALVCVSAVQSWVALTGPGMLMRVPHLDVMGPRASSLSQRLETEKDWAYSGCHVLGRCTWLKWLSRYVSLLWCVVLPMNHSFCLSKATFSTCLFFKLYCFHSCFIVFSHAGSTAALWMAMKVCQSSLWSRLKYLSNYWMDLYSIFFIHDS